MYAVKYATYWKRDMSRIALFANDEVGLNVCRFLKGTGEDIVKLYLHDPPKQKLADEIALASGCVREDVLLATDSHAPDNIRMLEDANIDFIITVYWAYLLKPALFTKAKDTLNFHPALLPVNRGWFPHVHSFLDGSPFGVTLHRIDENADTGPVWCQKEIFALPFDNAGTIYKRLQSEILMLFYTHWEKIKNGFITPKPQNHARGVYHKKKEIEHLDEIDLDAISARDLIKRLKARTFGARGFAYHMDASGRKVYLNLQLSDKP